MKVHCLNTETRRTHCGKGITFNATMRPMDFRSLIRNGRDDLCKYCTKIEIKRG